MKRLLLGIVIAATVSLLPGCDFAFSTENGIIVEVINAPAFNGGKVIVLVSDSAAPATPIGSNNPLIDRAVTDGFGHAPVWSISAGLLKPFNGVVGTTYEVAVGIDMNLDYDFADSGDYILSVLVPPAAMSNPLIMTELTTLTYTETDFTIVPP